MYFLSYEIDDNPSCGLGWKIILKFKVEGVD